MTQESAVLRSLLGDLSDVPAGYISDVACTKRFLERWTMDPKFQEAFGEDAEAAIASLGISLRPEQVIPFIDRAAAATLTRSMQDGDHGNYPPSVLRYRAFIREKIAHRQQLREECVPVDMRMVAWRNRQVMRCFGELGERRADNIVHAPGAFELAKGCTVGCWFCGVAAPKFEHTWPYTPGNAAFWKACLGVLQGVIGPCAKHGFLYWATDPLDNPDYEHFLSDFHAVLGRCPQTTTALGQKDIERTRRLLQLSRSMGSVIDRFSIIALNSLYRLHEGFSADELLRVELVPQNRESADRHLKSNAGRARKFSGKRGNELVPSGESSTIACVSGFLFNMIDRSVQLITPCDANDRWPLGYWVLDRGTFQSPGELDDLLRHMIRTHMRENLGVADTVILRPDVSVEADGWELRAISRGAGLTFRHQPQADELAALLADGSWTAEHIAVRRQRSVGMPLAETFTVLDQLFANGLLDEEPPGPDMAVADQSPFAAQAVR